MRSRLRAGIAFLPRLRRACRGSNEIAVLSLTLLLIPVSDRMRSLAAPGWLFNCPARQTPPPGQPGTPQRMPARPLPPGRNAAERHGGDQGTSAIRRHGRAGPSRAGARDVDGRTRRRRHQHRRQRQLRDQGPAGGPLHHHGDERRIRAGAVRPAPTRRHGHADRAGRRTDGGESELRVVARRRHLRHRRRRRRRAHAGARSRRRCGSSSCRAHGGWCPAQSEGATDRTDDQGGFRLFGLAAGRLLRQREQPERHVHDGRA